MALKIIKQGSTGAATIQRLSYSGERDPLPGLEELPVSKKTGTPQPEQFTPDLAAIERAAFERGLLQGEKSGREKAEERMSAALARYEEAIAEMGAYKRLLYVQVEREVVKLALEIAKKIVHREVNADREIVQTLVRVALSRVADKSAVTVHVHPRDHDYLTERRGELTGEHSGIREIALVADKSIERGGCLIETDCGEIDGRIEQQFREVERAFFE
jgi:flagellar assembly protein FliH